MKVKGYYNDILTEFEVEDTPIELQDEPIVFNSRADLDDYIGSVVISYLEMMVENSEGDGENG